jgi:uncharacterized phage protein (TIGR02218 family)
MTVLPQPLADHLAGPATTVCFCWIVTRADGVTLGFTDHDRSLVIAGVACEPETGFSAGAVESELGLAGDTSEVAGALSSEKISEEDISIGLYDGAEIAQYLVNWVDPAQFALLKRHKVGEIRTLDGAFKVELRSLSVSLDEVRGRHFLRTCDAELGDSRCGFDTSDPAFFADGTVVSAGAGEIIATGIDGHAARWFDLGRLTWLSGARKGRTNTVAATTSGPEAGEMTLRLFEPDMTGIGAGDTFRVVAGCDKRFSTCKVKFSNGINFQGFPHIPGNDAALTYADGEGDFDGGPIVP